jgi:hypothetical protein
MGCRNISENQPPAEPLTSEPAPASKFVLDQQERFGLFLLISSAKENHCSIFGLYDKLAVSE